MFTLCCGAVVVLELFISATSLGSGVLRYLRGAPGFPFSLFSVASVLMFDSPLSDSVCYFVGRFLLLLLLLLLFCTFSFVCFTGLPCSCHETAVTGGPDCWFSLLCNTWENSSLSASTGESNSLQLHGHLPKYITLLEGFGVFLFACFYLRPCSKLFKYTLEKAICSLNTPAPYLYSLQNILSPRPWFPRFGKAPVKINHIRGMTFILGAI